MAVDPPAIAPATESELESIHREERELVHSLGGFSIELAGGTLVTNERVPAPRFNFVERVAAARERMAGFFERALDHYFQRALRPAFHLDSAAPPNVTEALAKFGFRARPEPRSLLRWTGPAPEMPGPEPELETRTADSDELDRVVRFWTDLKERAELHRALEVAWAHPNPGEKVVPVLALQDGEPVSAALLHGCGEVFGIYGVATQVSARGRGAASALVLWAVQHALPAGERTVVAWSDHHRIRGRLERLGFREIARYRVFELDPKVELHLPGSDAPSTGPRWRPPRGADALAARKVA